MVMDVHGRDLRYFAAVAEELHFTRAAERLYVSQPALSKQIRMLEKQVGAALFERDRREVRLSPVGAALLRMLSAAILAEWEEAQTAVARAVADQAAGLVVGMSTSPGRGGVLPAIRSRFTAARPDARLRLRQVSWHDPSAGLADGTCDVAFVWLPLPDPDRYRWVVVAEEPRLVALPDTHPLAEAESVDFTDLLDEPFLALPDSAGPLRDYWLATEARGGRPAPHRRRGGEHRGDVRGPGRRSRGGAVGGREQSADHPGRGRHPCGPGHLAQPLRAGLARRRPPPAGAGVRACLRVGGRNGGLSVRRGCGRCRDRSRDTGGTDGAPSPVLGPGLAGEKASPATSRRA